MNDKTIDTLDEMQFTMTMADGSKKIMRFTLKDANLNNDETSLEFITDSRRQNNIPFPTDVRRLAKLTFNWTAFNCEIIDLE